MGNQSVLGGESTNIYIFGAGNANSAGGREWFWIASGLSGTNYEGKIVQENGKNYVTFRDKKTGNVAGKFLLKNFAVGMMSHLGIGSLTTSPNGSGALVVGGVQEETPPHLRMSLNGKETTQLVLPDGSTVDVFSGTGEHKNNPLSTSEAEAGPLPTGDYYIVGRSSGGFFGKLKSWATGRDEWFALYRQDGKVDDFTTVSGVERSLFRMHPGTRSAGCVTFCTYDQFTQTRNLLLNSPNGTIPGSQQTYYGTLTVE